MTDSRAEQAHSTAAGGAGAMLSIAGVRKSFGRVEVLRGIDVEIGSGEFITLLGPSGCGKTTLLRIIAGLEIADTGMVRLEGSDLTGMPANRRPVNTVFQSYALFPHLTVYENVAFGLRARRVDRAEIDRRVTSAMAMLQLAEFSGRHPDQLSGGQKQRVALARAVVNEPKVLLLDEPMSALDAKLRAQVQIELRNLQRRLGTTFILVTHDQDEAMTVSDRIFVMRDGLIVQAGTPTDVYERPLDRFVAEFLGAANLIAATLAGEGVDTTLGKLVTRTAPSWESGTIAIRPERIVVRSEQPASNAVRAIVKQVIYRGDHRDLFVDAGGGATLRVRVPSSISAESGDSLWLELPAKHLEVLRD